MSHTGDFSGAEAAMLRLLHALPPAVPRAVACPPDGPLAEALARDGVEHLPIPGTAVSFRLHPRHTAVGLANLARSALGVRAHARAWRPDIVHANTTRAGLLALALHRRAGGPRLVVQVHDIMPAGRTSAAVRAVLARRADRVVAVSDAATRAFNGGADGPARTVYISVDHEHFHPDGHDPAAVRASLGVPDDAPLLGVVAQISPWKGQIVAIEALARVRARHPDARLVLVGHIAFSGPGVRYDNAAYLEELRARVAELGVADAVVFAGQRSDVPAVMAALDLLLMPSWHEPFGTAAAEAMATGTVPLVSDDGGMAEFVQDGVSGRVLPPRDAGAWGAAAAELLDDPQRRAEMGRRAIEGVRRFTVEAYVRGMLDTYAALAR